MFFIITIFLHIKRTDTYSKIKTPQMIAWSDGMLIRIYSYAEALNFLGYVCITGKGIVYRKTSKVLLGLWDSILGTNT